MEILLVAFKMKMISVKFETIIYIHSSPQDFKYLFYGQGIFHWCWEHACYLGAGSCIINHVKTWYLSCRVQMNWDYFHQTAEHTQFGWIFLTWATIYK